jgi:predicted pyridoxine 5'-phosphate oxidase superfamily flavin-nucleotide-binding protein
MLKRGHCQTAPTKVSLWEATIGNTWRLIIRTTTNGDVMMFFLFGGRCVTVRDYDDFRD